MMNKSGQGGIADTLTDTSVASMHIGVCRIGKGKPVLAKVVVAYVVERAQHRVVFG